MTLFGRIFLGVLLLGVVEVFLVKVAHAISFLGAVGLLLSAPARSEQAS
jgi:hypothetical protein